MKRIDRIGRWTFVTLLLALLLPCAAQAQNNATVTLTFGDPIYTPAPINATVQIPCSAVSTANGPQECGALTDNWSWTLVEVTSAPSESGDYQPTSNYVSGGFSPATSATPNLSISFTQPGWYEIYVQVTDNYQYGCGDGSATSGPQAAPLVNAVDVDIQINDTEVTSDDIALVPLSGYDNPGPTSVTATDTTPCTVSVLGNPAQALPLSLYPGGGLVVAPASMVAPSSQDVGATPVNFTIAGQPGASLGGTTLTCTVSTPHNTVTRTRAVTLFTFQGTVTATPTNTITWNPANNTWAPTNGGAAVSLNGSVTTMPSVPCADRPVYDFTGGILQTASSYSASTVYGNPQPQWLPDSNVPQGYPIQVPDTFTEAGSVPGAGDDFLNGYIGPWVARSAQGGICASPYKFADGANEPAGLPNVYIGYYDSHGNPYGYVTWQPISADVTWSFTDFAAVQGPTGGYVPLAQTSWSLNLNFDLQTTTQSVTGTGIDDISYPTISNGSENGAVSTLPWAETNSEPSIYLYYGQY